MRTLFFIVTLFFVTLVVTAQTQAPVDLNKEFQLSISEGVKLFLSFLNFTYITVFMLSAWLINDLSEAVNSFRFLNFLQAVPKFFRSGMVGIAWAIIFYWAFKYNSRLDVIALLFSMLTGLVIYRIGIKKVFEYISQNMIGLIFNTEKDGTASKTV